MNQRSTHALEARPRWPISDAAKDRPEGGMAAAADVVVPNDAAFVGMGIGSASAPVGQQP